MQNNGNAFALRQGRWKLHRHDGGRTQNLVVEAQLAGTPVPRFALFDLSADPRETTDRSDERPDIAARMTERLEAILAGAGTRP